MNMSADSGSPSSINPSDQQRSQSRPPSPTRRTLLSEQPQNIQGTPPSTDIVSEQRLPEAAAIQQHPGGMGTEGGGRSVEHSSPSASSSQGDMADNEMEAGPRQPSEPANPAGPPPKKKRTRTLTTPHQSAVLHALLAQSRFPTTAMREEVGRSIGLSARKVQIWFQNQRQKARRPRGEPSAPLTRPPQYGPFSNAPPGSAPSELSLDVGASMQVFSSAEFHAPMAPMGEPQYGGAAPGGSSAGRSDRFSRASYLADEYPRSMGPSQLSGPGMPGPSRSVLYSAAADSQVVLHEELLARFGRAAHNHPYASPRPSTSAGESMETFRMTPRARRGQSLGDRRAFQGEFPIRLPPVVLDTPRASSGYPHVVHIDPREPRPLSSPTLDRRGRPTPQQQTDPLATPRPPLNIPPPFTLQPQPQWDDLALSPYTRPRSSSATFTGSLHRGAPDPHFADLMAVTTVSLSPLTLNTQRTNDPNSPPVAPPSRTRFDPVRTSTGRPVPDPHTSRPQSRPQDDDNVNEEESANR